MAETLTSNFSWTKPDPGASANTWGATLNAGLDKIDAQVFVNQQAGVPIGSISMFGGATPPTGWLLCNGASLSTAAPYDKLFAVIGYAFGGSGGSFNLPNMNGRFPVGAYGAYSLNAQGGENAHTLGWGEMPVHNHLISDVQHYHGVNDPGHAHGIADPGHAHGATQDSHSHTTPNTGLGSGVNIQPGSGFNLVNTTTTSTAQPVVHIATSGTAISIIGQYTNINVDAAYSGINITQNSGSGAGHENRPPYIALNFIIRSQ